MRKSLKRWIRSLEYRQESVIVGLALLSAISVVCTLAMCFINPSRAVLLLIISLLFIGALIYYRTHHHVRLRASITTLRNARGLRRKRSHRHS